MKRKTLLIPAILIFAFLMVASAPKLVNTTQAADVDTYIQIIRNLNTQYEEELVTLITQLNQHLYQGNMEQAKEIGNQLNQILDKLPQDQRDALNMGGCSITCGSQSCNVTNCNGISLCFCNSNNNPVCYCSKDGQCAANCDIGNCNANGNDDEITYCTCNNGRGRCATGARMPLASTIGILILISLIIGSSLWLWRRKRVSTLT